MGASGWIYYVPYQADVEKALQELRDDVFARRDYTLPSDWLEGMSEDEIAAIMPPKVSMQRLLNVSNALDQLLMDLEAMFRDQTLDAHELQQFVKNLETNGLPHALREAAQNADDEPRATIESALEKFEDALSAQPETDATEELTQGKIDPPSSIEEALAMGAEDGTHSILDIIAISDEPGFAMASPLPHDDLLAIFGTDKPTKAMAVEKEQDGSLDEAVTDRWQAFYFTVYDGDEPSELVFVGCSGD